MFKTMELFDTLKAKGTVDTGEGGGRKGFADKFCKEENFIAKSCETVKMDISCKDCARFVLPLDKAYTEEGVSDIPMKDQKQGEITGGQFIGTEHIMVSTSTGYLIKVAIKNDKFVLELQNENNNWSNAIKVLHNISKIFFNRTRTLCAVVGFESDEFVLMNTESLEVLERVKLGREKFSITNIAFNPFFEMTNAEMKEHIKRKMEDQPSEVKHKMTSSRQHI